MVVALSINCKKLRYLNLHLCNLVSDHGIQTLADLPQLEELDLSWTKVTDQHLGALCHLKKLNLQFCRNVHDTGVIKLIQSAINLQHLHVAFTKVTDNALRVVADASKGRDTKIEVTVDKYQQWIWNDYAALYPLMITALASYYDSIDNRKSRCRAIRKFVRKHGNISNWWDSLTR